jgi:Bacteriophage CI repressor helix-turn-helix domain
MKNARAFSFKKKQQMEGFADRLAQIIAEYGSRYALAQASGIPVTTLQKYTLGSKPGMDALVTLGRVANVNLHWLLTGQGQMRGAGQLPGAALADVVMVDQYDPKSSLAMPVLVNQFPLSRNYLERNLQLSDPSPQSLLAIESVGSLFEVSRGDLLLIDRTQAGLTCDGVYLLDLPGFSLRGVFNRPQGMLRIIEPRLKRDAISTPPDRGSGQSVYYNYQVDRRELLGDGRRVNNKVVGRAVWVGRIL